MQDQLLNDTLKEAVNDEEKYKMIIAKAGRCVVVVHFEASWADECTQMNDVLKELAKKYPVQQAVFIRVDAEFLEDLSQSFEVSDVPTFIILRNNKEIGRVKGADALQLTKKVEQHIKEYVPPLISGTNDEPIDDINTRLDKLINQAPVMLFMKGSPQQPRCKFSKETMVIFNNDNIVDFSSFDILQDNEVREGLKKYSDWPTYPQLYVNGKLIGGVDVIRELHEGEELASTLTEKKVES